jgi:hypothetical protein
MKILELVRYYTPMGTFGELWHGAIQHWKTVERVWTDNEKFISCIPEGAYLCRRINSPNHGETFVVMEVPDRYDILFHVANTMNDVQGCIGIGSDFGFVNGLWAVIQSGAAFTDFMDYLEDDDEFILDIRQYKP